MFCKNSDWLLYICQCHNFSFIFTTTHCDAMTIKDESGQHTAQQIQTRSEKDKRSSGAWGSALLWRKVG